MRTTITISLTESLKKEADKLVKEDHFSSVSELFRRSLDLYKKERLLAELRESQLEVRRGKSKVLSSLRNLA